MPKRQNNYNFQFCRFAVAKSGIWMFIRCHPSMTGRRATVTFLLVFGPLFSQLDFTDIVLKLAPRKPPSKKFYSFIKWLILWRQKPTIKIPKEFRFSFSVLKITQHSQFSCFWSAFLFVKLRFLGIWQVKNISSSIQTIFKNRLWDNWDPGNWDLDKLSILNLNCPSPNCPITNCPR